MNEVLKIFLSMSFSGALLILALLPGKRLLRDKVSRQWQYYVWLIVILRLLVPFGPEISLLGSAYQAAGQAIAAPPPERQALFPASGTAPAAGPGRGGETPDSPAETLPPAGPLQGLVPALAGRAWMIWLAAALGLLIRKITIYQSFVRYVNAGSAPVCDVEMLDRLSAAAERAGVRGPVELRVNPLVSSPLLIGLFHPCVVLPGAEIPERDIQYIFLHELTHCKRRDLLYKWLVQLTVCLHWFNPLVHLMGREITRACEFSCDEAVIEKLGSGGARDYGTTLLDAMASVGKHGEHPGAVTLSENKKLLKERLSAIMRFKQPSKAARALTAGLTLCVALGAFFMGIYPAAAADMPEGELPPSRFDHSPAYDSFSHSSKKTGTLAGKAAPAQAERYYEAGSVPLFQIAFSRLDEKAREEWLDRIYADQDIAFAAAAVQLLDEDCALIQRFAERAYNDSDAAFFSGMAARMSEAALEQWLDKALEDENWAFQSILFNMLDRDGEFDELEKQREEEWAEAQRAKYQAAGITMIDGKNYYYQGRLANIFLDIRANQSFYTLNINPAGTVNIKIIRDRDNEITGVVYMTEEEAAQLLGDMSGPDGGWEDEGEITIPAEIPSVKDGANG